MLGDPPATIVPSGVNLLLQLARFSVIKGG